MTHQLSLYHQLETLTLRPYQAEGVSFLAKRKNAFLADDMGLGKTVQLLSAAKEVAASQVTVVCPPSVISVWQQEALRFGFDMPTVLSYAKLPKAQVKEHLRQDGKKEKKYRKVIPRLMPMNSVLIVDEAHMFKNYKSQRSENLKAMVDGTQIAKGGRVWLASGTPLLNQPFELYALLKLMMADDILGGFDGFLRLFGAKKQFFGGYKFLPEHANLPEVKKRLFEGRMNMESPMLRRTKAEMLTELPKLSRQYHRVSLPAKAYTFLSKDLRSQIESAESVEDLEALESIGEIATFRKLLATEKYKLALPLIESFEACNEPLIVFSAHVDPIKLLGEREGWAVIHGEIGEARRADAVKRLQEGSLRGLACTIATGGVGITLTRAHHALFLDRAWTPALNEQAEARIHRMGQTQGVVIHYMESDHMLDYHANKVLGGKEGWIDGIF